MGCYGNQEISYNQKLFLGQYFFLHLSGPYEQIYTHYEMSYVLNLGLITTFHTIVYPWFSPHF